MIKKRGTRKRKRKKSIGRRRSNPNSNPQRDGRSTTKRFCHNVTHKSRNGKQDPPQKSQTMKSKNSTTSPRIS